MKYYIYFFNFKAEQNSAKPCTVIAVGVMIYLVQLRVLFSIDQIYLVNLLERLVHL